MSVNLEEIMTTTLEKTLAKEVIESLTPEDRHTFLTEALSRVIGDFAFKRCIEKAISAKAQSIMQELIETEDFETKLREQLETVLNKILEGAVPAFAAMVVDGFKCSRDGGTMTFLKFFAEQMKITG